MKNYYTANTVRLNAIAERAERRWPLKIFEVGYNDAENCYAIFSFEPARFEADVRRFRTAQETDK